MQVRFLEYLIALDAERHFARAAQRCNVSQPTLSAGLAALEALLGKRLVDRDRRFVGLTSEGAAVLPWARQMIAASHGLLAAVSSAGGSLTGETRIGCVPAAIPIVGSLATRLRSQHPQLQVSFRSMTSRAILQGIHGFELDAGITYLDHEGLPNLQGYPVCSEEFMFLSHRAKSDRSDDPIALKDALRFPLCLLPQSMQNRRILDARLAGLGYTLETAITADSFEALIALVATGDWATFLPDSYRSLIPQSLMAQALSPPLPSSRIGIVISDRSPISEIAQSVVDARHALGDLALIDIVYQS